MELVVLLLSLSKELARPDFKSAEAVSALGRVISQKPRTWIIEPADPRFSKAELNFEDLKAGKNLLTTIDITLREPWHTDLTALQSVFGDQYRWMPRLPDSRDSRILQLEPKTSPLASVVMLTVAGEEGQKLTVSKILLRRFYPSPKKVLTRQDALTLAETELHRDISDQTLAFIEEKTVERPFGWVFFFKAKAAIPGLGPVAVERDTGRVHSLRPSANPEQVISEFEKSLLQRSAKAPPFQTELKPSVSREQALQIAAEDVRKGKQGFSGYRPHAVLEKDGWHVSYKNPEFQVGGGGPEYLIDAKSGAVLSKHYAR